MAEAVAVTDSRDYKTVTFSLLAMFAAAILSCIACSVRGKPCAPTMWVNFIWFASTPVQAYVVKLEDPGTLRVASIAVFVAAFAYVIALAVSFLLI